MEPLSLEWTLKFQSRFEYLKDQQDVAVYNKESLSKKYTLIDVTQSNELMRNQKTIAPNLALQYSLRQFSFSAGLTGQWQTASNYLNTQNYLNFRLFNILPNILMSWKSLSMRLIKSITLPPISQLNPVADSSNPFFIRFGNTQLKPSGTTEFNINNFTVSKDRTMDYSFNFNYALTNDDIIQSRSFAANGIQTVRPVNRDGSIAIRGGAGISKEFKSKQAFQLSLQAGGLIRINKQSLLLNDVESKVSAYQLEPNFSLVLNWKDIVEVRPEYRYLVNRTEYTDPFFTNLKAAQHFIESDVTVRWPKNFIWESTVSYRYSNDVSPGFPKDNLLWNAGISLQFLKDQKGTLKFSIYDLLNRNNNLNRFTTQNQIIDQETNILKRYGLLTFTYNIRNIGVKSGKERFRLF